MAVDPRQVIGAFLTLTMFAMLSNMIKRDYFDSPQAGISDASSIQFSVIKVEEKDLENLPAVSQGPWKERDPELRPCWDKPALKETEESRGYITFSLTNGPEYHISQVAAAVVIASYLGATLVLPEIRGSELGQRRDFDDVYDVEKFMKRMEGVIKIVKELPAEGETERPAVVKVPNRVTEDFIRQNIEPVFQRKSYLRLAVFFPSTNLKKIKKQSKEFESLSCLASFGALDLKPEIQEVANSMVERLKALSQKSDGRFVAVDLRVDVLDMKGCKEEEGAPGRKSCYNAQEIGEFLRKLGFGVDTTIYLTQTWWHERLNVLKEMFPKSYTKDDIIPAEKKGKFLGSGSAELEKALDFSICSQSDVFVPAISGLFYGNVVGKRVPSGRTQILVPHQASTAAAAAASSPSELISSYVARRRHMAYSCYC
ncbi:hypothetical protein Taro_011217 [Colocasia esculenta]|uniref:O-fucosyltransferase family protein n=1 Tax=Colocasia esculenta TaxID=4460 RepID=A0A843UAC0_COLES|nr:hypothetical protein [Colocasia esculenta]